MEVVSVLEAAHALLARAGKLLEREDVYRDLAASVENELHKVRELELRMAIVAPMKAGKSTIVNSILGRSILPTRNSAMTSIPTEIICDNDLSAPILRLHSETIALFGDAWRKLHGEVKRRGVETVIRDAADYPELATLIHSIADQAVLALSPEIQGLDEVQRVLLLLNDLCRLAPTIILDGIPLGDGDQFMIPRLAVPFLQMKGGEREDGGCVVIVDTPGPNEARQHGVLERIVTEELKNTSVVLLVLDFTQLNTQAAELVSRSVQHVVAIVGEENLFVLVNKIDERSEKGMTAAEVRQFVASHLKLSGPAEASRVFEVSAKLAFCAANFLRELHALGPEVTDEVVRRLPSASELAVHVYGRTSWQEDLAEASAAELAKRARRLWALSKFDEFLTLALETVMSEVAPRCLSVALRVARTHLMTLRNDTTLRGKAIAAEGAALKKEIAELNAEMESLERGRQTIDEKVRATRKELREHLDSTRRGLQSGAEVNVEEFFRETGADEAEGFWKKLKRYGKEFLGWGDDVSGPRIVPFETSAQANDFANMAVTYAINRIRPKIERELARVDRRVESSRFDLEAMIENETRPILVVAAQRLRKQFDVRLEIPRPDLGNPLEAVTLSKGVSKMLPGGYRTEVKWERKWYVLWLYEVPVIYKVKQKDRFIVSLHEVAEQVNETIRQKLDQTAKRFDAFLEGDFKDRVDEYYRSLVKYLSFYRDSVRMAYDTQQLSLNERNAARKLLAAMATEGDALVSSVESLHGRLHVVQGRHVKSSDSESMIDAPLDLFFSYAHRDEELRNELEKHLALLRREGVIRGWHDRQIGAGEEWEGQIDEHLERAQIILLLISSDFIASRYCYDVEMKRALARHDEGTARVIPIIIRSCEWQSAPFGKLNALPRDGKAVKSWSDIDEAFADAAKGIREASRRIHEKR